MRVEAITVRLLDVPMQAPFRSSRGAVDVRTTVVVELTGPDGEGWGECAALPSPTYTAEFAAGAFSALRDQLAPLLVAADDVEPGTLRSLLADVPGHPMAKAGIELAVLDADARLSGRSLAATFSVAARSIVPAGAAIGLGPDPATTAGAAADLVATGYGRLKVKIEPGADVEVLRAVRDAVGPDVVLLADANGAYRLDVPGSPVDAGRLRALDDLALAAIEQPLPAPDLDDHARLGQELATPIALDESLASLAALERALERGACRVACVKAPLIGGWIDAVTALETCQRRGVVAYVGGMLDGGIGRAATLALAAHPAATLPGDQSASRRTFSDDVVGPLEVLGDAGRGVMTVPSGPGLGVEVDGAAVERLTRDVTVIHR